MSLKQWVNLHKFGVLVEDGIPSEERMDYVLARAKLKKETAALVKLRAVPEGGDNIAYSDEEKSRNVHFKLVPFPPEITEGKEIKLSRQFHLPAAGGNKYKIQATYKGEVVGTSKTIETIRRLYFQVSSMRGVPVPSDLSGVVTEFGNHHVELKEREDGRGKVELIKAIHNRNKDGKLQDVARPSYKAGKYWPYSVACLFANMSARYKTATNDEHTEIELPAMLDNIEGNPVEVIVELKKTNGKRMHLWTGLDDDHDAVKYWLVSASFTPDGGVPQNISRDDVHLHGPPGKGSHGYSKVRVVINELSHGDLLDQVKGRLVLRVRYVSGFQGGYSTGDNNLIVVCTKSWWTSKFGDAKMIQIFVHELGHKLGQVSTGNREFPTDRGGHRIRRETPDAPPKLYGEYTSGRKENNKGHVGRHCEKGMTDYDKDKNEWEGEPGCVMFGGTSVRNAATGTWHKPPASFCSDCGKAIRKTDLNCYHIEALKQKF